MEMCGGLAGAVIAYPWGLRARLSSFTSFSLAVQLYLSFMTVMSSSLRESIGLSVVAGLMAISYVTCMVVLIVHRRRGLEFPFRVMRWGFTAGAACLVMWIAPQVIKTSIKLSNAFSIILMVSLQTLPAVFTATLLWLAYREDVGARAIAPRTGETSVAHIEFSDLDGDMS